MKRKNHLAIIILSLLCTATLSATLYEDAEDGETDGWAIYDNDPQGATITNIFDTSKNSYVIDLNGSGRENSYQLGSQVTEDAWNNSTEKLLNWSMSIHEKYKIYIYLSTTNGERFLYYSHASSDDGFINDKYIHYGLGESSMDGTWQTFSRNLELDLERYEPGNTILAVNGIRIAGSGKFDDIELLIPPEVVIGRENPQIILNEYNAVISTKKLKNSGSDSYFGRITGNGGAWIELVTTGEHLDIRGAKLIIKQHDSEDFIARLPDEIQLGHLRRGTILTISEEPTDMSYAPFSINGDDWTLNINLNDLIVTSGIFETSSRSLSVELIDLNKNEYLLLPSGEEYSDSSIANNEVFKLKKDPIAGILPSDPDYGDDGDGMIYSTFSSPNRWGENGEFIQDFTGLRANQDLTETGGIVVSNIPSLSMITDAESILYLPQNNTLWMADDDTHIALEMNFSTQEVLSSYNDVQLGNFAETISDTCNKEEYSGACDIESVAYNSDSDELFIYVGKTHSQSAIFQLTREDINSSFSLKSYIDLEGEEYSAVQYANGEMIIAKDKDVYIYDYSNNLQSDAIFRSPDGKIFGMAYSQNIMWLTTSTFKLIKVNWESKNVEAIYDMTKNGVYDPRGIEIIDNKLYILEGMNATGTDQVLAPLGHALKNAIHIYDIP